MNKENQETDYELYTVTSVEPVIKYKENQECKCRCHTADPLNQCYYVSKAREEERMRIKGILKKRKIKDSEHESLLAIKPEHDIFGVANIAPKGKEYEWGFWRGKQFGCNQALTDAIKEIEK